jgi:hypothetical protein
MDSAIHVPEPAGGTSGAQHSLGGHQCQLQFPGRPLLVNVSYGTDGLISFSWPTARGTAMEVAAAPPTMPVTIATEA